MAGFSIVDHTRPSIAGREQRLLMLLIIEYRPGQWDSVLGEVSWLLIETELEGENGIRIPIANVLMMSSRTTPMVL
jgi:hypothetical protein